MKGFLSDNSSSVHEKVLQALIDANDGHSYPYGDDKYTKELKELMKTILGPTALTTVMFNGTGANVIGLSGILNGYECVLTVDSAHINVDECGAFERFTGAKIICVPHVNGKIDVGLLEEHLSVIGNVHHNQPKAISISQATEFGSVYTIEELKTITSFAHKKGLIVHMDGARIANACVSLGVSFKEMITDTDIDIVSFGGTKNGLMYGELLVTFDEKIHEKLGYLRKQGMQLASKMRYVSVQFLAYFKDSMWLSNATNANKMCQRLFSELSSIEEVKFLSSVDANIIYAQFPPEWIEGIREKQHFYIMDETKGIIRLVTSFDTTKKEVERFIHDVKVVHAQHETLMD